MKVLAVTLLVLVVGVELGFGQELPGLNPLDVHSLKNCGKNKLNGRPIRAFMGPCFDTPSCKIPRCCGIISGRDSLYRIEYIAEVPFKNGVFNGNLGGIGIGKAVEGCENELLDIELPFGQLLFPTYLAGYERNLCNQTTCPQKVGRKYTLDIPFRFVTTAMTTFDVVKANFVAQIITEKKEQALCWGLWATLVNADLIPSLKEVLCDITEDPIGTVLNPIPTLKKPLRGVLPEPNKFRPVKPAPPCEDK